MQDKSVPDLLLTKSSVSIDTEAQWHDFEIYETRLEFIDLHTFIDLHA